MNCWHMSIQFVFVWKRGFTIFTLERFFSKMDNFNVLGKHAFYWKFTFTNVTLEWFSSSRNLLIWFFFVIIVHFFFHFNSVLLSNFKILSGSSILALFWFAPKNVKKVTQPRCPYLICNSVIHFLSFDLKNTSNVALFYYIDMPYKTFRGSRWDLNLEWCVSYWNVSLKSQLMSFKEFLKLYFTVKIFLAMSVGSLWQNQLWGFKLGDTKSFS